MVCFLDMDGVLADFVTAACLAHGRRSPYIDEANLGKFDMEKLWGITAEEFWRPINTEGFWYELPEMPDAKEYVNLAKGNFSHVALLTAPSESPYCYLGKKDWISRRFPEFSESIIFASASVKKLLAGPGRVLIDDRDKNIEEFNSMGGIGILVPRLWNSLYDRDLNGLPHVYVRSRVEDFIRSSNVSFPRGEGSGPLPKSQWTCIKCGKDYWECSHFDGVAEQSRVLESQGYEPVGYVGRVAPWSEAGSTGGQASGTPFTFDFTDKPGKS